MSVIILPLSLEITHWHICQQVEAEIPGQRPGLSGQETHQVMEKTPPRYNI